RAIGRPSPAALKVAVVLDLIPPAVLEEKQGPGRFHRKLRQAHLLWCSIWCRVGDHQLPEPGYAFKTAGRQIEATQECASGRHSPRGDRAIVQGHREMRGA